MPDGKSGRPRRVKCPKCSAGMTVINMGYFSTHIYRRYECPNKHRLTSTETWDYKVNDEWRLLQQERKRLEKFKASLEELLTQLLKGEYPNETERSLVEAAKNANKGKRPKEGDSATASEPSANSVGS